MTSSRFSNLKTGKKNGRFCVKEILVVYSFKTVGRGKLKFGHSISASIETLYVTILGTLSHVTAIMETKFRQKMVKFEQIYLGKYRC